MFADPQHPTRDELEKAGRKLLVLAVVFVLVVVAGLAYLFVQWHP